MKLKVPKSELSYDDPFCNILDQKFDAQHPNEKWVSDITYIPAENRWYYMCVIMDLFARKIIAYEIRANMKKELVIDTFNKAYEKRGCPRGVIFHMDRGSQYISKDFRKRLDECNFVASYSRKGCPYDNACAEAFIRYMKTEEVYRRNYSTKSAMLTSIFAYIEGCYNPDRPHSANKGRSPNAKEKAYYEATKIATIPIPNIQLKTAKKEIRVPKICLNY